MMENFKKTSETFFSQQIQRYIAEQKIQSRKFPIRELVCKSVGFFSRVTPISTVLYVVRLLMGLLKIPVDDEFFSYFLSFRELLHKISF